MADQAGLSYGKVVGRFVGIVADTADVGENPDAMPMQGLVSFIPEVSGPIKLTSATPPVTVVPTIIQCQLDAEGDIQAPGDGVSEGVYLVATDTTNPSGWTYRVAFALTLNGIDVPMASFSIAVPAGSTQDLTIVSPVSGATGDPQPVVAPQEVFIGGSAPVVANPHLWFNLVGPDTYEMYLEP